MSILMNNNGGGGKMIIRASGGGGGGSWPSDSSHLTAGDGSSVTVGSGLSLSGGTLSATGGGGYSTVYEVDFSTLPSQVLSGGTATIDGKVWTNTNAANAGAEIVNGQGLNFNPTSNSDTIFYVSLGDLGGVNRAYRIYADLGYTGVDNSGQTNAFILKYYPNGSSDIGTSNWIQVGLLNINSLNEYAQAFNGPVVSFSPDGGTVVIDIDTTNWWMYSGAYAGGWPKLGACHERLNGGSFPWGSGATRNSALVAFEIYRQSGANSYTGTVKKLKVATL